MPNYWRRAGLYACWAKVDGDRLVARPQFILAAALAVTPVLAESPAIAQTAANPIELLFVGNSFTHGKSPPALNYNAGTAASVGDPSVVHDLLCPSTTATGSCTSGAEAVPHVVPTLANTPGATLQDKLNYLQANPSSAFTEVGPYSGVAWVFLQFTNA